MQMNQRQKVEFLQKSLTKSILKSRNMSTSCKRGLADLLHLLELDVPCAQQQHCLVTQGKLDSNSQYIIKLWPKKTSCSRLFTMFPNTLDEK